jgi:hypothetical protein
LTENKHALLYKHLGCLKCQHGYQNHHAADCLNDFPDGRNYKEVSEGSLLSQKQQGNVPSGARPVGVMGGASVHIEEVDEEEDSFVAGAVMPSAVLGSGSEMEEKVSPLTILHLR